MFRKILRWTFGLPLLIGGGGLFLLGLFAGTVLAVPAGLIALYGAYLLAPHRFTSERDFDEQDEEVDGVWNMFDPHDRRNAGDPTLPGTPAWHANPYVPGTAAEILRRNLH